MKKSLNLLLLVLELVNKYQLATTLMQSEGVVSSVFLLM